jgi:DNA-binding transcriptional MerR regulator
VTLKLYKAAEVCDLVQVQPYVLRSWEKEFPGIGIQKSQDGPRLYRQSDLEQVRRIKQLVFDEGLTVAGVRRRLEESTPAIAALSEAEVADVLDSLGVATRERIVAVRDGLRQLRALLETAPVVVATGMPVDSGEWSESESTQALSLQFDTPEPARGPRAVSRGSVGKSVARPAARGVASRKPAAAVKRKRVRA